MVSTIVWIGAFAVSAFFLIQYGVATKKARKNNKMLGSARHGVLQQAILGVRVAYSSVVGLSREVALAFGLAGGGILWVFVSILSFDPVAWSTAVIAAMSGMNVFRQGTWEPVEIAVATVGAAVGTYLFARIAVSDIGGGE